MRVAIVDGYNVTMADPATRALGPEGQRVGLVRRLGVHGTALLGSGRLVVVFDGRTDGADHSSSSGVEVRFSGDATADDVIVAAACNAGESVTVVTGDCGLAERVRAAADATVRVLGPDVLFEHAVARRPGAAKGRGGRYPASTVGIPKGGNLITQELKGIWLGDEPADSDGETGTPGRDT